MFGSRLKTWMENYIGRPRKKEAQKEKSKGSDGGGVVLESSESLACSDTGVSFSSQQVLSSSATDNREGYSTTTMESEKSGMTHCHTAVSLPSPESAYSTGYSTDGASPGESGPPEYYINIRTGKHYFPSPAPTPTSPRPSAAFARPHSPDRPASLLPRGRGQGGPPGTSLPESRPPASAGLRDAFPPRLGSRPRLAPDSSPRHSPPVPAHHRPDASAFSKSPCKRSSPMSQLAPIKLFLKSPRHEKGKPKADLPKSPAAGPHKKTNSSGKPKKWFRQPFQKFGHRRTDSCDETVGRIDPKKDVQPEKNLFYRLGGESSASPRQRNRIKTNPWLPTEPASSLNFHCLGVGFSPTLLRNRSCGNTPLQNRKAGLPPTDSEQDRARRPRGTDEEVGDRGSKPEKAASRQKFATETSDRSEDDLTLNEVMGTYNESYVYEKETDILSDSDPTDCEDYGTDSEAENGGDERDSHDDELDFIDDGSPHECEVGLPPNTGKCTYHDVRAKKNSFPHRGDRRKFKRESECRKSSRKDQDSKGRRDRRRQTRKSFGRDEEERKKLPEDKIKARAENSSGLPAQRMPARSSSKSVEGTPATARRHGPSRVGSEKGTAREGRRAVLVDFEADRKYDRLMKEAENILESMRNCQATVGTKEIPVRTRDEEAPRETRGRPASADVRKISRAEPSPGGGREDSATPARRSPKSLGLKLSAETPKKPKRLDFDANRRSSFRTRSSAHSPLDPLGPALRNFAVFSPALPRDEKPSATSSEDSEAENAAAAEERAGRWGGLPESPAVPVAFQSLDLGKPLAPYCPQSEPVKRKVYSCSKTYDRLVKRFENEPTAFRETEGDKVGRATRGGSVRESAVRLDGNQGFFPKERRRDGAAVPRGGILRRAPLVPGPPPRAEKPRGRSFDLDVFR